MWIATSTPTERPSRPTVIRVPRTGPGRPRRRPLRMRGDKAYSSRANRAYLRRRGIRCTIPEPVDPVRNRKRRGRAGGRPSAFGSRSSSPRARGGRQALAGLGIDGPTTTRDHDRSCTIVQERSRHVPGWAQPSLGQRCAGDPPPDDGLGDVANAVPRAQDDLKRAGFKTGFWVARGATRGTSAVLAGP